MCRKNTSAITKVHHLHKKAWRPPILAKTLITKNKRKNTWPHAGAPMLLFVKNTNRSIERDGALMQFFAKHANRHIERDCALIQAFANHANRCSLRDGAQMQFFAKHANRGLQRDGALMPFFAKHEGSSNMTDIIMRLNSDGGI